MRWTAADSNTDERRTTRAITKPAVVGEIRTIADVKIGEGGHDITRYHKQQRM